VSNTVAVRPQVKRVIVRTPGPQGPPGDVTGATVTSVAGRAGDVTLTKGDVGLANVDNTADASKPVSTLQAAADTAVANAAAADATTKANAAQSAAETTAATALSAHVAAADPHAVYQLKTEKGAVNGYASLDESGKVPSAQLPATGIGGSTGSTDNALLRADGTGGATAQSSTVTISDTGVITSTFYEISTATFSSRAFTQFKGLGSNVSVQVCPTGTGCFTIQLPDGTNTGGNARGDNSVDFSYSRTAATRVASGTGSFNGGTESTASGANSFAFNGTASGSRSIAMGGASTSASAQNAIALGSFMTASAQAAFAAGGEGNTASAAYSSAVGGYGNNASGLFAFAFGYYAAASLYGMQAYGSGRFAATGDAQIATMVARNTTSNATPTNLFLDGSSARIVVPANSSGVAMITVVARTNTAGDNHMTWRRRVNWERGVAVGTVSIDVETAGTDRGYTGGAWGAGPAWALSITADTTNGAINIIGTGAAATNIRWVASIEWVETTFA
jgi:hypothetical protein